MAYDIKDVFQAAIGAFSSILGFFLIRGGNPLVINPKTGLILGLIWLTLMYDPFNRHPSEHKIHFAGDLLIATTVCSWLSFTFGLVTIEELTHFTFFGSSAWLTTLLAVPISLLYDRRNILSVFDSYYTTKKR